MPATTTNLRPEVAQAQEALDALLEVGNAIPDLDGSWRSSAIANVIRHHPKAEPAAPIWLAINALVPAIGGGDPESEKLRGTVENLLVALWDADYERRHEQNGISLRTYEKLRRAHAEIGTTLDRIRLDG